MGITRPECVFVALDVRNAMRNIFPHYPLNDKDLKKSYWTQNTCFDFFLQLLSQTRLILSRNEWDVIKMYIGLYVE
jgi:hypothetical protein